MAPLSFHPEMPTATRNLSSVEGMLLMWPPGRSQSGLADYVGRAAKACQLCAAECSLVLLQDIFFGLRNDDAAAEPSVLVACAEACRLTSELLAGDATGCAEQSQSCARACRACRLACEDKGARCAALAAACEQCEVYLADLAGALGRPLLVEAWAEAA